MRNLVNKINYFDDKAIFEPINDSNSGAILKKVIDNDKTYFLKIVSKDSIDINTDLEINEGKAEILKDGRDITIVAIGKMVSRAYRIADKLKQNNIDAQVINARFLKPFDNNTVKNAIEKTKAVVTIEDGTIINGLATAVNEIIINENLVGIKIKNFAYPDIYVKHGTVDELEKIYGLDEENITSEIEKMLKDEVLV